MLFVHFGQQLIETARLQILLDLPIPNLLVIVLKPRHQLCDFFGRQLDNGRFYFRNAHTPPYGMNPDFQFR